MSITIINLSRMTMWFYASEKKSLKHCNSNIKNKIRIYYSHKYGIQWTIKYIKYT